MVELHAIKLLQDDNFISFRENLERFLSKKSMQKLMHKSVHVCQASMLGEIMVKKKLAKEHNVVFADCEFEYTQQGKPYLAGYKDFNFNISHSKEWVVVAFSNKEVGVDVEKIKPVNLAIANRFFSSTEYSDLINKTETEQQSYFFDLWTAKESFVKATGTGIANVFHTFSIQKRNDEISIIEPDFPKVWFKSYDLCSNYKVCVCSYETDFQDNIQIINIENLIGGSKMQ